MSPQPSETAVPRRGMCPHTPSCPSAQSADRLAAHVVRDHLEQGWELLCNGVIVFDDAGVLLPDGRSLVPGWAAPRLSPREAATG